MTTLELNEKELKLLKGMVAFDNQSDNSNDKDLEETLESLHEKVFNL